MRPPEHEDNEIIEAGQQLTKEGRRVTGFALRKILGGGEAKRLAGVWQAYQQQNSSEDRVVVELPPAVEEALGGLSQQLMKQLREVVVRANTGAVKAAEQRVTEIREAVQSERQAAEQEVQDAMDAVNELEKALTEHRRVTIDQASMIRELQEAQAEARQQQARLEQQIAMLETKIAEQKVENLELSAALRESEKQTAQWKGKADLAVEQFKTVQRWFNQPGHVDPPAPRERRPQRS